MKKAARSPAAFCWNIGAILTDDVSFITLCLLQLNLPVMTQKNQKRNQLNMSRLKRFFSVYMVKNHPGKRYLQ
ncbi:hypothetical protein [Photobacterium sp. 53610]|uniref:hypothetical protein n=1 Tax=Photobacterium sp. 53610 TaxID=3102789 RepID=UPI002EDA8028